MTGDDDRTQVITGAPASPPAASLPHNDAGLLPVGARLAEFEVTRIVGQGGFGVVYEAWDPTLERVVAIKEYLPTSLSTRQSDGTVMPLSERHRETFDLGMRSFINEARLLAQFDHPSLLKVYRFWQERGTTYMVMPFYRGDTLRQALAALSRPAAPKATTGARQGEGSPDAGGVDEGWLLRIMDGVTQALAVMHAAHCYHRDIAPDNIILLEGSGRPVVLDFGAARRVITDKTQAITVILKPGYAPIEQYAEMPDMSQGAWTDVYALAAVMHVAVCGRAPPPSVARLLADSYVPLMNNEVLRQRYGTGLLAAIDAGLGVRPESRPQSMAELRAVLGLDGEQTVIRPAARPPVATPVQPAGRRGEGGAGGAAGAAGAAAGTSATPRPSKAAATTAHPGPADSPRRTPVIAAAVALLVLAAAGGGWWLQRGSGGAPSATPTGTSTTAPTAGASAEVAQTTPPAGAPAPAPPSASAAPSASTAPSAAATAPAPAPMPPPVTARSPAESLQALGEGAVPGFDVKATAVKAEVVSGKDKLAFQVRSARDGFVYVYLLSSGGEMFLLFPNLLDKYNKITAGSTLALPRASWPMNAGGPPGVNQFAVLVSERERDFSPSGVQNDGVFPQFSLPVLSALEAARGSGPSPLLGKPVCAASAPCNDVYGVGNFKITER